MFQFSQEPNITDEIYPSVKKLYRVIQRHTGKISGYGHNCSIYGEITIGSFQRVVNFLKTKLGFDQDSLFLDIGSGLGKPNFHVLLDPGVQYSFGVELEALRYSLSLHNLSHLHEVPELCFTVEKPNIFFSHNDVTEIESFHPFTHVYAFDVGMPPDTMNEIAKAMENSSSVKAFVSFHKPKAIIEDYQFPVQLVGAVSTSMHGSSEGHRAYIFCHKQYKNTFLPSPVQDRQVENDVEDLTNEIEKVSLRRSCRRVASDLTNKENSISTMSNKLSLKKIANKKGKQQNSKSTSIRDKLSQNIDPVFRKGFDILEKYTNSQPADKYSGWIKRKLDVYFPEERPKRGCTLKLIR